MDTLIKIELSEQDAKLFVEYQKRYSFMQLLESINAFDIRNGSVTIHFNAEGGIGSVEKQQHFKLS